jgi:hypothetical protein
MNKHLAEISKCVAAGAIAMLVIDWAGWHGSSTLIVPDNIVLLTLPPLCTRVENIWEYLRGNAFGHQVWETYEAIHDACCNAWNTITDRPDLIRSIGKRERAEVKI